LQQDDLPLFDNITVCARDDGVCTDFVGAKVDAALTKLQTLLGIHLLRVYCTPQLNYLAQVVPPSLTADHFNKIILINSS
jgi:hypothetical protein